MAGQCGLCSGNGKCRADGESGKIRFGKAVCRGSARCCSRYGTGKET
jgi:hypothetical protein